MKKVWQIYTERRCRGTRRRWVSKIVGFGCVCVRATGDLEESTSSEAAEEEVVVAVVGVVVSGRMERQWSPLRRSWSLLEG